MFEALIQSPEDCFGERFARTVTECKDCRAPVILDGKIFLLREICASQSQGGKDPVRLNRLTSVDVLDRLEAGASACDIFLEILNGAPMELGGSEARQILRRRFQYLEREFELPVPVLPTLRTLQKKVRT